MRAGTTCKNAACKAVSTWQGPSFTLLCLDPPVPCSRSITGPGSGQVSGRRKVAVPTCSIFSSHPGSGHLCHLPLAFLQEAPHWWYICVSLLLSACTEIQHMFRVGHVDKMHTEQFPHVLN